MSSPERTPFQVQPGKLRDLLVEIRERMMNLETDLNGPIAEGAVALIPIRHELVEASEAVDRAVEHLDGSYRDFS